MAVLGSAALGLLLPGIFRLLLGQAILDRPDTSGRQLQAALWHPMLVEYDYSHLSQLTPEQGFYLQALVVPGVSQMVASIRTQGFQLIPTFNETSTTCTFNASLLVNYTNQTTNADLLVFFMDAPDGATEVFSSVICGLDFDTNRSTIGIIHVNGALLTFTVDLLNGYIRQLLKQHIHLLAMNAKLFPYLTALQTAIKLVPSPWNGKQQVTLVATPTVLKTGASYFGCVNFTGLYLEDESGFDNGRVYWEKLLLGNELMVADLPPMAPLSVFTLAFLNDTGWYSTASDAAESLTWGFQKGCGFLTASCGKPFNEYCPTPGTPVCTADYSSKSLCAVSKFSNGCPISNWMIGGTCPSVYGRVSTAQLESGGPGSRCFSVTSKGLPSTGCYNFQCVANYVTLIINGNQYTCGSTGNVVTVIPNVLSITCPNITDFCGIVNQGVCVNDCGGVGTCMLSKSCNCHPFFAGASCDSAFQCNATSSGPILSTQNCTNLTQFNASTALLPATNGAVLLSVLCTLGLTLAPLIPL